MKLTSRATRRVAAAVAAASATLLIPAAALAASGSSAAAHAAAAPRCSAVQMFAWIGLPGDGGAGTVTYWVQLSNVSHRTCTLKGYPGVAAVGRPGQLGSPAGRAHLYQPRLITLRPGATAHFDLGITDISGRAPGTCDPVIAQGLKIRAPGDRRSQVLEFAFVTCKKRGASNLGVTTTLKGTGIPQFSR